MLPALGCCPSDIRPLTCSGRYAYVYLDAIYLKGRLGKAQQVCSRAVIVAMGVNEDGHAGSCWASR